MLPDLAEWREPYDSAVDVRATTKIARLFDAGTRRHVVAMGIHQFSADHEYPEMIRHRDLDEQRRDLLEYNIHAKNNAGQGLLHMVAKRSCNLGEMRDTKDLVKLWELGLVPEEERTPER